MPDCLRQKPHRQNMADVEPRPGDERVARRGSAAGVLPTLARRTALAQAVLILALVWGYAGWRVHADREQTLDVARHELGAVAGGMYVHMQAVLSDSLGAARAAALAIAMHGGFEAISDEQAASELAREISSGDYLRALFIAAPKRYFSVARDQERTFTPPAWVGELWRSGGNVYIGPTLADPVEPAHHAIPVAVHVVAPNGSETWAGALLGVEVLDQMYESMAVRDGALSLVSTNGDVLLRVPPLSRDALRRPARDQRLNVGDAQLFREAAQQLAQGGIIEGASPLVPGTRIYAIRRLRGYHIGVVAARDKDAILQPWRERTRSLIYVLAGASILFVTLTMLLRHFVHRVERGNRKLAELNAQLEERVAERTTELQEANRQLALANQELEAFTASASHDLRSPLGAIAGQAGLLSEELEPAMTESVRCRIERIQANVARSAEIIDGLLSLARISRQELLNERVDLSSLAASIVEDLRLQYPRHEVQCSIEPQLVVDADPRLMKSLLANLLGNAWKYTSRTPQARVELARAEAQQTSVFSVRDNGAGFDMANAKHLFEPFHRLHAASDFPGIGIGLATVARIVQRYSGKITVESAPGKGATFRFTLPAATAHVSGGG
jgi:signal transduction histidine kinase